MFFLSHSIRQITLQPNGIVSGECHTDNVEPGAPHFVQSTVEWRTGEGGLSSPPFDRFGDLYNSRPEHETFVAVL
jgi:hypothetical protein